MVLLRVLLVITLTLSASFSGVMAAEHAPVAAQEHVTVAETHAQDLPLCCVDSTERMQTCHALPALLPAMAPYAAAPNTGDAITCIPGLLLTGINPTGPLDPPRLI